MLMDEDIERRNVPTRMAADVWEIVEASARGSVITLTAAEDIDTLAENTRELVTERAAVDAIEPVQEIALL